MEKQSNAAGSNKKQTRTGGAMNKLFNMDNPIMKALSIAADLLILNILTVVLSIPIITMGPAVTAMNDVIIRIVRGEEGYTVQPFFQAFKVNFKKGMLLGLILVAAAGILYFDYLAAVTYIPVMKVGIAAIGVIVLAISIYAFALLARYENTFGGTLKNAAMLAVANFPKTLFMVVCTVGLWVVCIHFYRIGAPILLLLGLSLPCYVNILFLNRVFNKLEGVEEDGKNKDKDNEEFEDESEKFLKDFYNKND